jgi:hypothetical protein
MSGKRLWKKLAAVDALFLHHATLPLQSFFKARIGALVSWSIANQDQLINMVFEIGTFDMAGELGGGGRTSPQDDELGMFCWAIVL